MLFFISVLHFDSLRVIFTLLICWLSRIEIFHHTKMFYIETYTDVHPWPLLFKQQKLFTNIFVQVLE